MNIPRAESRRHKRGRLRGMFHVKHRLQSTVFCGDAQEAENFTLDHLKLRKGGQARVDNGGGEGWFGLESAGIPLGG